MNPRLSLGFSCLALAVLPTFALAQNLRITELMAASEETGDWFELTNTGTLAVSLTGSNGLALFRMDDSSDLFANSADLLGISSIAPGESVVFLETDPLTRDADLARFRTFWGKPQITLQLGYYSGEGLSLSATAADGVTLFTSTGVRVSKVAYAAGEVIETPTLNYSLSYNRNDPSQKSASVSGVDGAYTSPGSSTGTTPSRDVGSPGTAVPEPASAALLTLGGLLAAGSRGRRRC